jgi:DNA-binding IscR family transcriptional regulator
VDRVEGDVAVIELDNRMINIPLSKLPKKINIGDVIQFKDDNTFVIEQQETNERRERIKKLMDELFEEN